MRGGSKFPYLRPFSGCSAEPKPNGGVPRQASENKGAIGARGQLVDELVTHAATRTLRTQCSKFGELGKIALGGGGTDVSEMRVLFVGHSAQKATSAGSSRVLRAFRCRSFKAEWACRTQKLAFCRTRSTVPALAPQAATTCSRNQFSHAVASRSPRESSCSARSTRFVQP